jgi:gliding motility-associated-like protein
MTRNFYIFVFGLLAVFQLNAQFPNPLDFNTATNATNTGTIPVGSNDLHWTVSTTGIGGPYVPAVSCGNQAPGNWVNSPFPNANWITYPHTCLPGNPSDHTCVGNIDEYYKLTFNLPAAACGQSVATPSAYCLSLDYYADNWVWEIFVNGVSAITNPTSTPYWSYGFVQSGKVSVSLCNNWQVGTNNVLVHVMSGGPFNPNITGFLAQANQTLNTTVGNPLSINSSSQTNVTCNGGSNGAASITASGGNGTYTYTWLPSGGNSNSAANLSAGVYSVLIASGSCSVTQTFTITQPAPVALSVSPNASVCPGSNTTFTAGGTTTYSWNTGATSSSISVNTAGVYTVTGTTGACSNTQTVSLSLLSPPSLSISGNTLVCPGMSTTLTASGANTYTWSTFAVSQGITVSPSVNTTYSVAGTDPAGCTGAAAITVSVSNTGSLTVASPSTLICIGETTTLTANGATTYTWNPGNSNSPSIVVTPTVSQTYTVLGSFNTCSAVAVQDVSVTPVPTVNINPAINANICSGNFIQLIASGAPSYTWMPGNMNGSMISVNPSSSTIYTVTGGAGTCTNQAVLEVTVTPGVNLNVSANSVIVCAGTPVILSVQGASVYTWDPGNYSGSSYTVSPGQSTTYTVTGSNGGCSDTRTVNVYVHYVTADFTENSHNVTNYDLVQFVNTSKNNAENYWFFDNGGYSTEIDPAVIFEEPGTYVACLLVKSPQGCYDTLCKAIHITCSENAVFVPNTFTPNHDNLNDVFRVHTLSQCVERFGFYIFNRWGEKIFETDKLEEGWDGTYKGVPVSENIYAYLVEYTMSNHKSYSKSGHVTVIK